MTILIYFIQWLSGDWGSFYLTSTVLFPSWSNISNASSIRFWIFCTAASVMRACPWVPLISKFSWRKISSLCYVTFKRPLGFKNILSCLAIVSDYQTCKQICWSPSYQRITTHWVTLWLSGSGNDSGISLSHLVELQTGVLVHWMSPLPVDGLSKLTP